MSRGTAGALFEFHFLARSEPAGLAFSALMLNSHNLPSFTETQQETITTMASSPGEDSPPSCDTAWPTSLNVLGFLLGNQQENEAAPDNDDDDDESYWDIASDISGEKWLQTLSQEPQT